MGCLFHLASVEKSCNRFDERDKDECLFCCLCSVPYDAVSGSLIYACVCVCVGVSIYSYFHSFVFSTIFLHFLTHN